MVHYKVIIQFTAIVEEEHRYFPKDFYDEVFVDLPENVSVPQNRIYIDVVDSYYLSIRDVISHRIEVVKL